MLSSSKQRWITGRTLRPSTGSGCSGCWLVLTESEFIRHSLTFRSRKALLMTETELRLIAAPAMIGLSSKPKNG